MNALKRLGSRVSALSILSMLLLGSTLASRGEAEGDAAAPWWHSTFLISTFSAVRHGDDMPKVMAALHDLGFNALESNTPMEYRAQDLTWAEHVEVLEACERHGMRYFLTDHARLTGVVDPNEATVLGVVEDFGGYPALGGYYLWDEPFLEDFPSVRRAAEIIRSHDGARLPMVGMLPSYGRYRWPTDYPAFARRFMRVVDPEVVAFDFYGVRQTTSDGPPIVNPFLYRDLRLWSDLAREHGRPLWFYGSAVGWGAMATPSLATLRLQAATALAYGARGLIWFMARDYGGGAVDFTGGALDVRGEPGLLYEDLKQVNHWMRALAPTLMTLETRGLVLTHPVPDGAGSFTPGFAGLTSAPANLLLAQQDAAGERYLWVVNRDLAQESQGELGFRCAVRLGEVAADGAVETAASEHRIQLDAGEGKLLRISPMPGCNLDGAPVGRERARVIWRTQGGG